MKSNKTCSLLKTSVYKYTPDYPSSVLFFNISNILSENTIQRNVTARAKNSKAYLTNFLLLPNPFGVPHVTPRSATTHLHGSSLTSGLIWPSYRIQQKALGETTALCAAILYFSSENFSVHCLNGHRT